MEGGVRGVNGWGPRHASPYFFSFLVRGNKRRLAAYEAGRVRWMSKPIGSAASASPAPWATAALRRGHLRSEVPRLMVRVGRQTRLRRIQTKHVFH